MVFSRSRSAVSCDGQIFHRGPKVQETTTESFVALDTARLQIQELDRAIVSAHKVGINDELSAHVFELSDTACFSVSAAEAQYFAALAEYEASFHPLRRRMKKFGTRTKAYHAANVEPRQARLMQARAVFEKASKLKRKVEKSAELAQQASTPSEIHFHCSASVCTELLSTFSGYNAFGSQSSDSL